MPPLSEPERQAALFARLRFATTDMENVASIARHLAETFWDARDDPLRFATRATLETGLFTTYARCFNRSKGDPPLPPAPSRELTEEERQLHQWAVDERNQVSAHIDRHSHRQIYFGLQPAGDGSWFGTFYERWEPPTEAQLNAIADLAEKLAIRYRELAATMEADVPRAEQPEAEA